MQDSTPENFAKQKKAVVVAPAGCGKTHLIAASVAFCTDRQLILTHTNAGVQSLKRKLRKLKVSPALYHLETIHSFALRYASAYPKAGGLKNTQPRTSEDYNNVIASACRLFDLEFPRTIFRNSYGGIFVDEYQDCSIEQHVLICKLAEILPCRIVGDPLQGIFGFKDTVLVDWDKDIFPVFEAIKPLDIPYRWKDTNPELGEWLLQEVRPKLERNKPIQICSGNKRFGCIWNDDSHIGIISTLKYNTNHSTFVICEPIKTNYPHYIAKFMKNLYRTIEPVTDDVLYADAKRIDNPDGIKRLEAAINFAKNCLTKMPDCDKILKAVLEQKNNFRSNHKTLYDLFSKCIHRPDYSIVNEIFAFLENQYEPTIKRYQLWWELKKALQEVKNGQYFTLEEASWAIRNRIKYSDKGIIYQRCISRTVLLKGLECEQAIVVNADTFDNKNLYVALTRPSKKLIILSKISTICPS
jgi:DNA helicase-2/ATP-dependent DNA helicase PcrA